MSEVLNALSVLVDNGLPTSEVASIINDLFEADGWEDEEDKKLCAVAAEFDDCLDAVVSTHDDCIIEAGGAEYLVLDEDEREARWDDCLDNYLDECVEGGSGPYFDREKWKRDARMDGAGHSLSSYDGNEYEYNGNGEWFWMYRTN